MGKKKDENRKELRRLQHEKGISGWLSPSGKLYACCWSGHYDLAAEICECIPDYSMKSQNKYWTTYETDLEYFGWRKIQAGYFCEPRGTKIGESSNVTEEQFGYINDNKEITCEFSLRTNRTPPCKSEYYTETINEAMK